MAWKKVKVSGPRGAPPVDAERTREKPSRSRRALKSPQSASLLARRSPAEGVSPRSTAAACLRPMGMKMPKSRRLTRVVSMMRTRTLAAMFSQTLGGEKMRCGPISRMFSCTVSGSSGKLTQNPNKRADDTAIICSPIQARGRKETNSSVSRLGSACPRFQAMDRRFLCESMASLGRPVEPEVVAMSAVSSGETSSIQVSNSWARSWPRARTSSKDLRPGAS